MKGARRCRVCSTPRAEVLLRVRGSGLTEMRTKVRLDRTHGDSLSHQIPHAAGPVRTWNSGSGTGRNARHPVPRGTIPARTVGFNRIGLQLDPNVAAELGMRVREHSERSGLLERPGSSRLSGTCKAGSLTERCEAATGNPRRRFEGGGGTSNMTRRSEAQPRQEDTS